MVMCIITMDTACLLYTSPRTCYSADKTGHVILHTTYEQCLKEGVHFLQEWYLLDLVKSAEGHVGGAVVWNMKEGKVEQIKMCIRDSYVI